MCAGLRRRLRPEAARGTERAAENCAMRSRQGPRTLQRARDWCSLLTRSVNPSVPEVVAVQVEALAVAQAAEGAEARAAGPAGPEAAREELEAAAEQEEPAAPRARAVPVAKAEREEPVEPGARAGPEAEAGPAARVAEERGVAEEPITTTRMRM